jgi:hypothetical protein
MNITIKTAEITIGEKAVPLTKSIVKQLYHFSWTLQPGWTRDDVKGVGSVDLGDELAYLIQTPDGLQRTRESIPGLTNPTRIILLK